MNHPILITGAGGMVGSSFQTFDNCLLLDKKQLNISDYQTVKSVLKQYSPQSIIHLAAMTNVDYCQQHPQEAYQINSIGTQNLASISASLEIPLIVVSTGAVFSGRGRTPFTIHDIPNPLSIYARSKLVGEMMASDINPQTTIVRTGWIFGGLKKDQKFVGMVASAIQSGKRTLKAITTTRGCPTYSKDLAHYLYLLAQNPTPGIQHVANSGTATRYEMAKVIAHTLNPKVKVFRASEKAFSSFQAPRPRFEVIQLTKALRPWEEALTEYLTDWKTAIVHK